MAKLAYKEIKKQCNYIKKLWAEGMDDAHIRDLLKLSMKQWETRLAHIANERYSNNNVIFLKYQIKSQKRYDQLEALSLTAQSEKTRLDCIKEMKAIDEKEIELGQTLGVYPKMAKSLNIRGDIENKNLNVNIGAALTEEEEKWLDEWIEYTQKKRRKRWRGRLSPEEARKCLEG